MKTKCPYCRHELDFHEMNFEADLRAAMELLPTFGKHVHLVMGYCYLFGVTPFRLKAKKLRLILEELKRLYDAQAFSYQKTTYYITQQGIAEALDVAVKKHFDLPLESHNYLKKIMIAIGEREGRAAGRAAEKDLRLREESSRAGGGHPQSEEEVSERPSPEEAKENLKRINAIISGIGVKK